MPPRSWTAWPLSSEVVPRSSEQVGATDGADEWTLKRKEHQRPSRELEEILMAVTLRISRERFKKCEWETSRSQEEEIVEEKEVETSSSSDGVAEIDGDEAAGQTPRGLRENALGHIPKATNNLRRFSVDQNSSADGAPSGLRQQSDSSLMKEGPETLSGETPILQRPTVSTDDERSGRLLRPTIRHTLSRLDELLMALHNARQTCLYYASEQTESQSDFEDVDMAPNDSNSNGLSHLPSSTTLNEMSLERTVKRSGPGRPPKTLHMPAPSAADTLESIKPYKKETRGRKRKLHVPLQGESHEEMLVRIARQQKKAMPFTAPRTGSESSAPTKSARGSSQKRGTSAHAREKRSTRLGLRDWSEVLGTAALLGIPPEVLDRATQRCATLFGEGMTMLSLVENPTSDDEDQLVDYLPGEIPDFEKLENPSTAGSESDQVPTTRRRLSRARNRNRLYSEEEMAISKSEPETRSSGVDTAYYCPYKGYQRRTRGFSKKCYSTKHLREVHKLDQRELKEAQEDSQEEMEGGVHINGFMKELKRRIGWRALDGKPRRKKEGEGRIKREESGNNMPKQEEIGEQSTNRLDGSDGSLDEAFESD